MRDLLLLVLVGGSLPVCFFHPYFGVLMWLWIAYFNPHRFTFSYMYDFPIAAAVAVPTIAGLFLNRKFNRPLFVRENLMLLVLWGWFLLVYVNASKSHCSPDTWPMRNTNSFASARFYS